MMHQDKIRILFFIEKFGGGGAEKVLRDLVNHMDQSKFEITVQSVWPYEERKLLKPGIRYKSVYPVRNRLTEKLYRLEAALGWTYAFHIKDNYDIEAAFLESGPTKILAASTNRKAKKIAWVHSDLTQNRPDVPAFVQKARMWYDRFDYVVCVSQDVKMSFDDMFENRYKTLVLYNTINDEEIRTKAETDLPGLPQKRKLTVVTVGRLTRAKAYDRLLRIHRQLLGEGFDYDLWILGEGEDRPELEAFITENGLSNSVKLFGFCKNPYPYIKTADLLVCSSRYEGFSTFVTEGMILGKPVVTTDCPGMRELLGNSEYGLITDNSEEALLEGMRRMLKDDQLRERYREKAISRGDTFSSSETASKTESFFIKALHDSIQ